MNEARAERARGSMARAYRMPALLAVASMVGLGAALLGDGAMDAVSWLALGAMVVLSGWAFGR